MAASDGLRGSRCEVPRVTRRTKPAPTVLGQYEEKVWRKYLPGPRLRAGRCSTQSIGRGRSGRPPEKCSLITSAARYPDTSLVATPPTLGSSSHTTTGASHSAPL